MPMSEEISHEEATRHVAHIRELASAYIRCADEFDNEPSIVEEYLQTLWEAITAYTRAIDGEVGQCTWQLSCPRDEGHPPPHYYVRADYDVEWVAIQPPRHEPMLPPFEA
jgi:hypothetical protein